MAFVLALATVQAAAGDWVYVARKGDNLWDLAAEYLVSMRYWGRFRALNDVPNPRQMPPGTEVRFPAEWLRIEAAPVEISESAGDARVVRVSDGAMEPALAGLSVRGGDRVVTGVAGSVVLAFVDGSKLLIRPESDISVDEAGRYGRSRLLSSRSSLRFGRVEGDVPAGTWPQPRFEVSTPAAVAVVRGTRFRVSGEGETPVMRAEVEDGLVEVANDRASVTVPAGSGTLVRADARPERPRPLLRPVDLGALPARFERRQLRIGWPPAEAASAYRVQISESVGVSATLLDELVETSRVTLPDPPDGNYVLKVRAVDGDGLEGIEAQHAFELDARPEPPATIAPRPGRTVRVVRPALRWAATADAVAYRVQVARDAGFTDLVLDEEQVSAAGFEVAEDLADGAYHWRVATGDASGEVGPFGDVQAFTVRKAPPAPDAEAEVSETGILLRWQAGLAGQTYEVQFAADEQFTESVRTEATEQPESAIEPPERALWFRVRIVDVDGYLGPYGTTQRIDPPKEDPWWMLLLPLLLLPVL